MTKNLTAEEIAAIAMVMELAEKYPPEQETWDKGHGQPTLSEHIRDWLKEKL